MAVGSQPLQHRRLQGNAGLVGGPDRLGVRVVRPACKAQHQAILRAEACQPVPEVQLDPVFLRVAQPATPGEAVHRPAVPLGQGGRHIPAPVVTAADGEDCPTQGQQVLARRLSGRAAALVWEDLHARGMIEHDELEAVEVRHLAHGFGQLKYIAAGERR